MLTTSRKEVVMDRYNTATRVRGEQEAYGDRLGITENEINEPARRTTNYFSSEAQENDYSTVDIATKLFGNALEDDVDTNNQELGDEDLVPSMRTLDYANPRKVNTQGFTENGKVVVHTSSVTKTNTKIAVAAYIAVILVLAVAIAFTTASVSGVFAQTLALGEELSAQGATIESMAAELATVDEVELINMAESLGYHLPNTTNTIMYDAPTMRAPQSFNVTTNWFDQFCDSLCRFFGGN